MGLNLVNNKSELKIVACNKNDSDVHKGFYKENCKINPT